jgi:UDP-N-acetylglucosamine 2-epimerase
VLGGDGHRWAARARFELTDSSGIPREAAI